MALQNRVTPFGDLIATPARGLLMGNRGGRFHDPATRRLGGRRWASRQWIACALDFKGRHREVWGQGYTELFFLDEVTALAAGHRPCFECRRADAQAFAGAVAAGLGLTTLTAPELDRRLDEERRAGREKRRHAAEVAGLPDGAAIEMDGVAFVLAGTRLLAWSPAGYGPARPCPAAGPVALLTPPSIVAALRAGYRPLRHPSAGT